jgi:signal transduction histidine kinase
MFESIIGFFSSTGFMPHIHCYLARPGIVWTMFITDLLIGVAYVGISFTLWALTQRIRIPFSFVVLCFGVFIAACGATHFMEVWTLWHPDYWWAAGIKVVTAIASVGTGVYLYRLRHAVVTVAEAAKLSEQRRLDLEALTESLEQRVRERTAELEASEFQLAQALRARDEFISVASHELKTPVTSMGVQIQMLERILNRKSAQESLEPETIAKAVVVSKRQLKRLNRLVDDMLDISRLATGRLTVEMETFELGEMVEEVVERFRDQLAASHCALELSVQRGVMGTWDRFRLDQAVTNLISNAIKYAPGSVIEIQVSRTAKDKAFIRVRDHGSGIKKEDQARIFERFERAVTHGGVSGLGVGLYIVNQIVRLHGGAIWVESTLGQGASFSVELPLRYEGVQTDDDAELRAG